MAVIIGPPSGPIIYANKHLALHGFWSRFGLTAYDELTVPDDAELPYITYEEETAALNEPISASVNLWYRSTSWIDISQKADEIASYIGMTGKFVDYTGGSLWITRGAPFAQRMSEPSDDTVRRIRLNVNYEFMSAD